MDSVIVSMSDNEWVFNIYDGEYNFDICVDYHSRERPDLKMSKESAKDLAFKIISLCAEHCGVYIDEINTIQKGDE